LLPADGYRLSKSTEDYRQPADRGLLMAAGSAGEDHCDTYRKKDARPSGPASF
jgi:hypothetical protein